MTTHSWAVVMRNILQEFSNQDHKLYLKNVVTENLQYPNLLSASLRSRLDRKIKVPDLDICYTAPINFEKRFEKKAITKMAIFNYETSKLPPIWFNNIKYVDYVLPSSNFSKNIFLEAGWPEKKLKVIPHGINISDFENKKQTHLETKKSFKFLNISIPHYRKNIDLVLESYFQSFSNQDDVCLVIKTNLSPTPPRNTWQSFEVDVLDLIKTKKNKYLGKEGGLPEIEIIKDKLQDIVPLYNACNVLVSASSSEGFGLPLLEGLAAGKIVIAPNCSGQVDFLNKKNALLVETKEIFADKKLQYWVVSENAKTNIPIQDDLSSAMINAYKNFAHLSNIFESERKRVVQEFTWENVAKKILEIK